MRFSQLKGPDLGFFYIFALAKQKPIMKKKLSLLFLICILSALNINATVYEGSCGDNVNYSLDTSTGVLSITGTGAMKDYNYYSSAPWYSNRSYIKTVEISNGVTSIGDYAFNGADIPTVISLIENPFAITGKTSNSRTFTQNTFNNATLYVPKGTIEKYKATDGWKDFANIKEGNPTAINVVENTKDNKAVIYNLNGVRLTAPQKGVNLIKMANGNVVKTYVQ